MSDRNPKPPAVDPDYILTGRPYRTIFRLAWPAIVSMMAHTVLTITDAAWVGRLGAAPMAAVISSMFFIWIIWSLSEIIASGAVALIARRMGEKDLAMAGYTADHIFRFTILFSTTLMVGGLFLGSIPFQIMGTAPEVTAIGVKYLRVFTLAWPFLILWDFLSAIYRAAGDTKTPLIINATCNALNIILDPLLIFGVGPFPELGAVGAAIATFISYGISTLLYFVAFTWRPLPFSFKTRFFAWPDWALIRRMIRIGLPIATAGIVFSTVYLFVNRVATSFGTTAVAALGIGNRIESINYLVCFGFLMAVSTLVGQNLGANNPQRAESLAMKTLILASGFTAVTSALFFIFALPIARFFTADPAVWPHTVTYLQILALSQVHMSWEIVIEGVFTGAGDTMPPMLVSVIGSIARVPLAYALAIWFGWGVAGIWWTITISTLVKGTVLFVLFKAGRWKQKEV